jgi:hypothetical protein
MQPVHRPDLSGFGGHRARKELQIFHAGMNVRKAFRRTLDTSALENP